MQRVLYLSIIVVVLFISSCKENILTDTVDTPVQRGMVNLVLPSAPTEVVEVVATLSRHGHETRTLSLSITDSARTATGIFSDIAVGIWHLRVDALDDSGVVRYTGETDVDVLSGQTTQVDLVLYATNGNIEIRVSWGSPSCTPIPDGLVSWWTGDGTANDLLGVNNGVLQNGASYGVGKVGHAFSFDGIDDYVRIPTSSSLNPSGSFSVEAWIYPTRDAHATVIEKWGDNGEWSDQRAWVLGIRIGQKLDFGISDAAHQRDESFHQFFSPPGSLVLNAWNYVVGVYDQSTGTRKIYINGIKVAERIDPPITIHNSIADVSIGSELLGPSRVIYFFPGKIDEVSFYHRALSSNEIRNIYHAGSAGKCRP
jgi:hypothetical protein